MPDLASCGQASANDASGSPSGEPAGEPSDAPASTPDPDPPSASVPPRSAATDRDGAAPTPDLEVIDGAAAPHLADALADGLRRVLPLVAHPVRRVHVRLVRDAEMARLHERHLGVPGTTDVITFPADADSSAVDVDLALCVDEASRQASRRGHDAARELLLYAVHGVLHEAGHDDHERDTAARMHAEEDRLLAAAGFGPVYARPEADR